MALLKKIKEKLGFGTGSSDGETAETTVTVEQDAATGSDDGGAATEADEPSADPDTAEADEPSAGPDTADAGAIVEEAEPSADADPEAGSEGAETGTGDESDAAADSDVADEAAGASDEVADDGDDVAGDPVDEIKGIGPAYAERLAEIDIETVADLAAADPVAVADGASVGEKRAARWIDRATEF